MLKYLFLYLYIYICMHAYIHSHIHIHSHTHINIYIFLIYCEWGDYVLRRFFSEGIMSRGDIVRGDYVLRGLCPRGLCPRGLCPGFGWYITLTLHSFHFLKVWINSSFGLIPVYFVWGKRWYALDQQFKACHNLFSLGLFTDLQPGNY